MINQKYYFCKVWYNWSTKNYLNHLAEKMLSLEYYLSLKYPMSIYPEEDGGYTVMIPDLPGCISQGDNLEEAIENINEARELWIETVYCSGKQQIPLPSKLISIINS